MAGGLTLPVLAEMSGSGPAEARVGSAGPPRIRREDFEAISALPAALAERIGAEPGVVLVTGDGDGKCAAGICLAAAAAVAGSRAALLECDLASPALAASLGLEAAPGLGEYLRHQARAGEILQRVDLAGVAVPDGSEAARFVAVTAGAAVADGADPLASADFGHAVEKLRGAYRLLVIDGPPVDRGGAALTHAAAQSDATLACVNRSRASGRQARALEAALAGLQAPTAGVVLVDG